jgi:hypothetical protein
MCLRACAQVSCQVTLVDPSTDAILEWCAWGAFPLQQDVDSGVRLAYHESVFAENKPNVIDVQYSMLEGGEGDKKER